MTIPSASVLSLRIDTSVADLLATVSETHGLTESITVEKLILEEAARLRILPKPSPGAAFVELIEEIREHLNGARRKVDEHVTLSVFNWIRDTSSTRKIYEAACVPPKDGVTAEKRRQFVHQRIGRFVKECLGLESAEEIMLPRNAETLIRSYTRLVKG